MDCSIKSPPSTHFLMARNPSEGPPEHWGRRPTVQSLGDGGHPAAKLGTMDRCWCGGQGNSGPSTPNVRAVGREARAQDCLVQVPDLLVSRDLGILPTGHFPLTSEKGFTMLQINVTAQATVLAGAGKKKSSTANGLEHYLFFFLEQFRTATLCYRFRWSGHG